MYPDLSSFLRDGKTALAKGPIGLIMVEDDVEVRSTIEHHLRAGFQALVVFASDEIVPLAGLDPNVHWVTHDMSEDAALENLLCDGKSFTRLPGVFGEGEAP